MVAGFEADVGGCTCNGAALGGGVAEGEDFGVGLTGFGVEALADGLAVFNEDAADHGVGGGLACGLAG